MLWFKGAGFLVAATSSDAAVINAIVTILKNLGFCS